jgi:hypothetical protein
VILLPRRRFVAALGAGALAACTPAASPKPTDVAWREFRTEHLTLTVSSTEQASRDFALIIEGIYRTIRDVGFPAARADGHVWVVLPRDRAEYVALLGKTTTGKFHPPALRSRHGSKPTIAVEMSTGMGVREVLAHEMTHALVYFAYGDGVPTWYNEGIAEYYSRIDVAGGEVFIGRNIRYREVDDGLPPGPGWHLKHRTPLADLVPPSRLAQTDEHDFRTEDPTEASKRVNALYLSSYLFVHLMMNGSDAYRARGAAFRDALAGTWSKSSAYARAFGDMDPATLDADFIAWARRRDRPVIRRPYHLRPREILGERALDRDDVQEAAAIVRDH